MEAENPPVIERKSVSRARWGVHLALMTFYIVGIAAIGVLREHAEPVLSGAVGKILLVSGIEALLFGVIFGLAWVASRASVDDLLLRWRMNVLPVVFGAGYSVALRLAVGMVAVAAAVGLIAAHVMTVQELQHFAEHNRPEIEKLIDVDELRNNPFYFWTMVTVVSFALGGLREELWRSAFLAGMKKVWPRQFGSTLGQVCAVLIAAVIFGAAHATMGILAMFLAGVLGVGLGLIMVFHRSIWPAVFAHGFFDATSMALIPWAMEFIKQHGR